MKKEKLSLTPMEFNDLSTCRFVMSNLPEGKSILDVGAGRGSIAAKLAESGYRVTAVDHHSAGEAKHEILERDFKQLGKADFGADFKGFDALLFSFSLHHLEPLRATMKAAFELLAEDGVILVDDFCYERVEEKTCAWLFPLAQMLLENSEQKDSAKMKEKFKWVACRRPSQSESIDEFITESLRLWRQHHEDEHHIAPFEHVKSVLGDYFDIVEETRVPYLFRYFAGILPNTAHGGEKLADLAHWEAALAQTGAIAPVGVRIVARGAHKKK